MDLVTKQLARQPELIAGWGFRNIMHDAWNRWPDRVLHVDAGFWGREKFMKVALGGRWTPIDGGDYSPARLQAFNVSISKTRTPGRHILVCGMSAKAAISWGLEPEGWERRAIRRLNAAGGKCTYRPKPTWPGARALNGAIYDRSSTLDEVLVRVQGVVSHHSNSAIDALARGLPIFVETGIAKPMSAPTLEDIFVVPAPKLHDRMRFLNEVAWHQWSIKEIETGAWLKPPAPLAGHPLLGSE